MSYLQDRIFDVILSEPLNDPHPNEERLLRLEEGFFEEEEEREG